MPDLPGLPPGTGPTHIFKLKVVDTVEEAERVAGFTARRPTRGVFHHAAVGLAFGFPVILVAHHVGPRDEDLESMITEGIPPAKRP